MRDIFRLKPCLLWNLPGLHEQQPDCLCWRCVTLGFYDLHALLFTLYLQQNGVKKYRGATILTFDPHYKQRSFTGNLCNTFFFHSGQQDAQERFSIKLLLIRFFLMNLKAVPVHKRSMWRWGAKTQDRHINVGVILTIKGGVWRLKIWMWK